MKTRRECIRKKREPGRRGRQFLKIDRDNFDQALAAMRPRLAFRVVNHLTRDGGDLEVELRFTQLRDFEPDNLVQQVEPFRRLVEVRERLGLVTK
jgi:type VI secretion system protein ImpB